MVRYRKTRWVLLPLLLVAFTISGCSGDGVYSPYGDDRIAAPRQPYKQPRQQHKITPAGDLGDYYRQRGAEEVKIALLLPLSGRDAALARSLLDAATLGLYDKYATLAPEDMRLRVSLLPKDTMGTEEGAFAAAQEALAQGAQLIIGPLYSKSTRAILPLAKRRGVNIISFSNNPEMIGSGAFQFGFMTEEQVERVTQFAWKNGYTAFAAMVPDSNYGRQVVKYYRDLVRTRSGRVHPLELYKPQATNLAYRTSRMVRVMLKDNVGKQALLLPERGDNLKTILEALLQKRELLAPRNFKLLGTGLWDDPNLLKLRGLHGAWFASSPPRNYRRFERRFTATYGYKPLRLASLAYDAVALAASLALTPAGADFSAEALTLPGGYSGPANGVFRFLPDGVCQRNLAVLEVTPQGFRVIDPAPLSFVR